jgi:predicted RND superfamily exporter protein
VSAPGVASGPAQRSERLERLVRAAMRRPRATLAVWGALAALAAPGIARLEIDTTTSSFLDRTGPAWRLYQRSLERHGGDEFLTVALEGRDPFDPEALRSVHALSEALAALPGVRRVDSLRTVPIVSATPDGSLDLAPGLADGPPATPEARERLLARVRADRIAPRSLVSADEKVFAINVLLDADVDGARDVAVARADELVAGRAAWVSGVPVFRTKVNSRTGTELLVFVPLTLALVGLVLRVAFGSLRATAVGLATAAAGTWLAFGAMGAMGTPLSLSTVVLPPILLATGCAYVVHVLSEARGHVEAGPLEAGVMRVVWPIAVTGTTTVIGFLSMATVGVDAIRELGTYGGIGVFGVLAASLTLAPACLRLWPIATRPGRLDAWLRGPLCAGLVALVTRHRRAVLAAWAAATLVCGAGLARLHIETDIILWFPTGTEVRDSYEAIRTRLSGITPMNVLIESRDGTPVTEPRVLAAIDALASWLEAQPEIGRALSLADPLRQIHAGFTGRPDAGLPESRELAEQYLLLLSSVERLGDVVHPDRQSANVLLRVDVNGSRRLLEVAGRAERWWAEHGPAGFAVHTTGIMFEFARAEEAIAWGQIRGLWLAFFSVGVVVLAIFRSPWPLVAAFIPNAVPPLVGYGALGLAGIPLDAATVCVASIAFGIGVDDTVHLATGYRGEHLRGRTPREALSATFDRVVPALVLMTFAIGLGFVVLGVSEFTLIRHFGLVTAALLVLCLAANLTLLPALLLRRS